MLLDLYQAFKHIGNPDENLSGLLRCEIEHVKAY